MGQKQREQGKTKNTTCLNSKIYADSDASYTSRNEVGLFY